MRNTQEHTEPIQEERSQKSKHLGLLRGTGVHSFLWSRQGAGSREHLPDEIQRDRGRRSRYFLTAAKTFWLAARRATGALEVVKVVPKVSPGALRPNRSIFTVSLPTRVARPR